MLPCNLLIYCLRICLYIVRIKDINLNDPTRTFKYPNLIIHSAVRSVHCSSITLTVKNSQMSECKVCTLNRTCKKIYKKNRFERETYTACVNRGGMFSRNAREKSSGMLECGSCSEVYKYSRDELSTNSHTSN